MTDEKALAVKDELNLEQFKTGVDNLLAKRDYFIEQVLPKLKENQDYYTIKGKKSLAKGGAEKLASIYNFTATFEKDTDTFSMLDGVKGMVVYLCTLSKNGQTVGQGRGADTLIRNQNDPNKTIKMAQKRAYVDAVIRTTGLSDIFTQDLEDENGKARRAARPVQAQKVDYLAKLKAELFKRGAKTLPKAIEIYNAVTGENIKSLKVEQATAKKLLFNLLNAPMSK